VVALITRDPTMVASAQCVSYPLGDHEASVSMRSTWLFAQARHMLAGPLHQPTCAVLGDSSSLRLFVDTPALAAYVGMRLGQLLPLIKGSVLEPKCHSLWKAFVAPDARERTG
jgi:hypothetical protein